MRLFLLFALLSSCCGYHFQSGTALEGYKTLSIAPIEGDDEGTLLTALYREMTLFGHGLKVAESGSYTLQVQLFDSRDEDIGFLSHRVPVKGSLTKKVAVLAPVEGRRTTIVTLTLIESASQQIVLGPVKLSSAIDYDFDPSLIPADPLAPCINVASLGQINDSDTAKELVHESLQAQIAQKVVAYLNNYF
ncbi:MAG: LptE-family protein [Chlamydiales bacterium]|jgi:hypothetical protein|nr:LptE-family protein [Chlamydiales bacterium]